MDHETPEDRHPTANHPLNAEPRPKFAPTLAVIGLIVGIGLLFLLITWVRYNT